MTIKNDNEVDEECNIQMSASCPRCGDRVTGDIGDGFLIAYEKHLTRKHGLIGV